MNYTSEIVIIGGGIIGCASAYYLAKKGCKVTVLEGSDYIGNGGSARIVRTIDTESSTLDVKDIAGQWEYTISDGANTVDANPQYNGLVTINTDGTYSYREPSERGNTTTGTVKIGSEEIGGTVHTTVSFYEGEEFAFGGYYNSGDPEEISIGNGGMARLLRLKPNM